VPRRIYEHDRYLLMMVEFKKKICLYIASEWISKAKSNQQFADTNDINEKTVRRILDPEISMISLPTLKKICENHGMKLSEFFKIIDE